MLNELENKNSVMIYELEMGIRLSSTMHLVATYTESLLHLLEFVITLCCVKCPAYSVSTIPRWVCQHACRILFNVNSSLSENLSCTDMYNHSSFYIMMYTMVKTVL